MGKPGQARQEFAHPVDLFIDDSDFFLMNLPFAELQIQNLEIILDQRKGIVDLISTLAIFMFLEFKLLNA